MVQERRKPARLTLGEPICRVIQWTIQGRVPVGGAGRRPSIELFDSVQEAKLLAEQQWMSHQISNRVSTKYLY